MNFIEQIFRFAPDNGSGALEFLLFAIPTIIVCAGFALRRQSHF